MTPEEELFKHFFNAEQELVKDMDDMSLAARKEELQKAAFEAKVRLYSTSATVDGRKKDKKAKGFITSLASDDVTLDAINKVKVRQDRMSKQEKGIKSLIDAGIDEETARQMMSASVLKSQLDKKFGAEKKEPEPVKEFKPIAFVPLKKAVPVSPTLTPEPTTEQDTPTPEQDKPTTEETKTEDKPKKEFKPFIFKSIAK